ncbi:MAG: hypothetical protein ACFFD1_06075, partial [Candidatus Thorarchaeota archaeon]
VDIYSLANTSYNTDTLTINYTYSYAIKTEFYIDDTLNQTIITNGTQLTFSDGYHNITIIGYDSLNRNSSKSYIFLVDTIKPTITISSPTSTVYSTNDILIQYEITENNSFTTFIIIDGFWNETNIENGLNKVFLEGEHNITIYVVDSAGNQAQKTIIFTVNLTSNSSTTSSAISINTKTSTSSSTTHQNSSSSGQVPSLTIISIIFALMTGSTLEILYSKKKR